MLHLVGVGQGRVCPKSMLFFFCLLFCLGHNLLVFEISFTLIYSLSFVWMPLTHKECLSLLKVDFSIYNIPQTLPQCFGNISMWGMDHILGSNTFPTMKSPTSVMDSILYKKKKSHCRYCEHHNNCMSCFHVYCCLNITFATKYLSNYLVV